jgi:hypothetical protein
VVQLASSTAALEDRMDADGALLLKTYARPAGPLNVE